MQSRQCPKCKKVYDVRLRKQWDSCPYCAREIGMVKQRSKSGWTDDAVLRLLKKCGYNHLLKEE